MPEMTNEEFDEILADIVKENAGNLLTIPGAYEVFSEHFNNEVLSRWEIEQAEKYDGHKFALDITDDDLCAECKHLDYKPGNKSLCDLVSNSGHWPAKFDEDGYSVECSEFEATAGSAEEPAPDPE